jgi:hypothetical protein
MDFCVHYFCVSVMHLASRLLANRSAHSTSGGHCIEGQLIIERKLLSRGMDGFWRVGEHKRSHSDESIVLESCMLIFIRSVLGF